MRRDWIVLLKILNACEKVIVQGECADYMLDRWTIGPYPHSLPAFSEIVIDP